MKFFLLSLAIMSSMLLAQAQENHREATNEEKEYLLPEGGEEKLKMMGAKLARENENTLMEEALLKDLRTKGQLNDDQKHAYIQHLTNQGLTKDQIKLNIDEFSRKYFSQLQLKRIKDIIPQEKQKEFEIKFNELEKKDEEGKLGHDELDKELTKLYEQISASPVTKENELKMKSFSASFLTIASENTLAKKPFLYDPKSFSPLKIRVPKNFSTSYFKTRDPLCLNQSYIDPQVNDLKSQVDDITKEKKPLIHQIYFSWGYNRAYHSNTDVKFTTQDGTFTVHDAVGKDRPSPFDPKVYFNPTKLSIPQYNLEIGVMFNEKWGMELKQDHMKWVFDNKRPYELTGDYNRQVVIKNDNPVADWDLVRPVDFSLAKSKKDATWLSFEHSDGYNYLSLGAIYNQNIYQTKNKKFSIDSRFGGGAGLMIPKTRVMMHVDRPWNWEGLDNKFHIAGGGIHGEAKLKFTFWNSIYLQASTRGTYIKVKDALVDGSNARMEHIRPIASVQFMGQIGYQHMIGKKKNKKRTGIKPSL